MIDPNPTRRTIENCPVVSWDWCGSVIPRTYKHADPLSYPLYFGLLQCEYTRVLSILGQVWPVFL